MQTEIVRVADDSRDSKADEIIFKCMSQSPAVSFFLFAGAGSGKTRSLVILLQRLKENIGKQLWLNGQKIAVITYTNAACDEIIRRLDYDALFEVATIHSFIWNIIKPYTRDIRIWMKGYLEEDTAKAITDEEKGRKGTKASKDRIRKIKRNTTLLQNLDKIKKFTYDPNGSNSAQNALNHSQVISIGVNFLTCKPLMQQIFLSRFPILLIDESQDTKKELMDAFFLIQKNLSDYFALGLFGDTMQRIYLDGKSDLAESIPDDWAKPAKIMNHRCPERIVTLLNKIRGGVDAQKQCSRQDKQGGIVRFFIYPHNIDKDKAENDVRQAMSKITMDHKWIEENETECLILEHHMAAERLGCLDFFAPLYSVPNYKTSLQDGSLTELRFFTNKLLPIIEAYKNGDKFKIAEIVKKYSPILQTMSGESKQNFLERIQKANNAVSEVINVYNNSTEVTSADILAKVREVGLFELPDILNRAMNFGEDSSAPNGDQEEGESSQIEAWRKALMVPPQQIISYSKYINGETRFNTHQGVKGLEYPRVMVVMDDKSSRGTTFSYETLFAIKERSASDKQNEAEGKDYGIARTKRLFYVVCSRAEESLALVSYTESPENLKNYLLSNGWFSEEELVI